MGTTIINAMITIFTISQIKAKKFFIHRARCRRVKVKKRTKFSSPTELYFIKSKRQASSPSSLSLRESLIGKEECEEDKSSSSPFAVAWECEEKCFFFHRVPRQRDEDKEETKSLRPSRLRLDERSSLRLPSFLRKRGGRRGRSPLRL